MLTKLRRDIAIVNIALLAVSWAAAAVIITLMVTARPVFHSVMQYRVFVGLLMFPTFLFVWFGIRSIRLMIGKN